MQLIRQLLCHLGFHWFEIRHVRYYVFGRRMTKTCKHCGHTVEQLMDYGEQ